MLRGDGKMAGPLALACAAVLLASPALFASPLVSLNSFSDWNTAIGAGQVRPVTGSEWSTLVANNPGMDAQYVGTYSQPTLGAAPSGSYPLPGGDTITDPGMVMGWGDADGGDYTAAWAYDYGLDPNVIGQTITAGLLAPQFTVQGVQMNSIGFGLVDGAGAMRSWTWNTAAAANPATNTIAWNQIWNVSIGPIAGPIPPGAPGPASATRLAVTVNPIFFNNPVFNPANVLTIVGLENGAAAAMAPVPPGGFPNMAMWNWWQNLNVTPEPGTLALLGLGGLAVFRRRRS